MSSIVQQLRLHVQQPLSLKVDMWLLGITGALLTIGFIMIASSSMEVAASQNDSAFYYVLRHGVYLGLALAGAAVVFSVPIAWWEKSSWLLLLIALAILLLVLLPGVGRTVNGSTRWIGFGAFNVQPSEVAKVFLVAYVAAYLVRRLDEVRSSLNGVVKPIAVVMVAAFLLLMEPDFGAVVVMMAAVVGIAMEVGDRMLRRPEMDPEHAAAFSTALVLAGVRALPAKGTVKREEEK